MSSESTSLVHLAHSKYRIVCCEGYSKMSILEMSQMKGEWSLLYIKHYNQLSENVSNSILTSVYISKFKFMVIIIHNGSSTEIRQCSFKLNYIQLVYGECT